MVSYAKANPPYKIPTCKFPLMKSYFLMRQKAFDALKRSQITGLFTSRFFEARSHPNTSYLILLLKNQLGMVNTIPSFCKILSEHCRLQLTITVAVRTAASQGLQRTQRQSGGILHRQWFLFR